MRPRLTERYDLSVQHERRRHSRLEIPLESVLRLAGSGQDLTATMQDLSAGGAGLLTTFEIPVGTDLERFHFELPAVDARGPESIELAAKIARCERLACVGGEAAFLIGVQFIDITRELFDRIQKFVFQNLRASQQDRVEIQRPIAIRFDRFDDFVDEVSVNLSHTGMFIRTRDPRPPGAVFNFQFQLGEDFSLIEGRAEVVWRRRQSESPDKPPGMGVKFVNLDVPSQRLIDRLISQQQEAEKTGEGADAASQPAAPPTPGERAMPGAAATPAAETDTIASGPKPPPDLRHAEATIVGLDQVNALREAAEHLRGELDQARRQHQSDLQELRARLEDRQAAASSEIEERLRDVEAARRESERQRAEVSAQLEASRRKVAELQRQATGSVPADELERVGAEREALQAERDELRERAEGAQGEAAELRRRLDEGTRETERLAGERAELQTLLDDRTAEEEAQRLGVERDALQATHDRLLADLDRANREADEMRRQLDDQKAVRQIESERLAGERAELQTAHDDLQRTQDELRAAHEALRRSHDDLEAARDALRSELEGAQAEAAEARRQLDERQGDAAGLRDELESARGQLEELDAARQRAEDVAAELESANQRTGQLETELGEAREDAERARATAEETATALAAARQDTEQLRGQLDGAAESRLTIESELAQIRDEARRAARLAEEREVALRAEAENAGLALAGDTPPRAAERGGGGRVLRIAALLLVGAVLGTLAVGFFEPLGSRTAGETTRRAAVPAAPESAETAPETSAAPPPAAPTASAPTGQPAMPEPAAAMPEPAAAEPEPATEAAPDPATAEQAVRAWAAAWSDQRVDDYLDSYADSYQPPDGQSRARWAATRRERIERPRSIQVGVDAARTVQLADDRVSVSFDQSYASDTYSDKVRKTLLLVWQDGAWKIAEERVIE